MRIFRDITEITGAVLIVWLLYRAAVWAFPSRPSGHPPTYLTAHLTNGDEVVLIVDPAQWPTQTVFRIAGPKD